MKIHLKLAVSFIIIALGCQDSPNNVDNREKQYHAAYFTDALDSLYVIKLDGSENTSIGKFTYRGSSVDWIPNSASFVFSEIFEHLDTSFIWKYDCLSGIKKLLLVSSKAQLFNVKVSPDGNQIACNYSKQICIFNLDGSNLKVLTNSSEGNLLISWSPDGKSLLFNRMHIVEHYAKSSLWTLDISTSQVHLLADTIENVWNASYSPGGIEIVYSLLPFDSTSNSGALGIMNSMGNEKHLITQKDKYLKYNPMWSPNCKMIAFTQLDENFITKVHLLDLTNMKIKQLSYLEGVHFDVKWVNDNLISYYTNGLVNLCTISKDGSESRQVTHIKLSQAGGKFTYAISKIAF